MDPKQVRVNQYGKQRHIPISMSTLRTNSRTVDVRPMPAMTRHSHIIKIFEELAPGESLLVINDHEPIHLVQFMKHERQDFDASSYQAHQKGPKEWVGVFKKKDIPEPTQNDGVVITSFEKERNYDDHAFSPIPIYSTDQYRVILTYFKAGQFIPIHKPDIDLVFLVQSGTGEIIAGERRAQIKPGDITIIPKGQRRGIKAYSDMEALHLVSPAPSDSDHEEVVKKLGNGQFE